MSALDTSARPPVMPSKIEGIARSVRDEARSRGQALVIGNRAGLVEWIEGPWQFLTGFPLDDTIGKPISHFLSKAGLEVELVDFVARHFLEGRRCNVSLSFETLDGRELDLHLAVEPVRNEADEIDRFIALLSEQPAALPARPGPRRGSGVKLAAPRLSDERKRHRLEIEALADASLRRFEDWLGRNAVVERILEASVVSVTGRAPGEPGRVVASARLVALIDRLIEASLVAETTGPRYLTLHTGRLHPGRSHHSLAHGVPQRRVAALEAAHDFLELHDTSIHLDGSALLRIRAGLPSADRREIAWVRAETLARSIGATLLLDSTPGCGNQALVVFDTSYPV